MSHGMRIPIAWSALFTLYLTTGVSAEEAFTLSAPAQARAGSAVPVKWSGARHMYDSIDIVPVDAPNGQSALTRGHLHSNPAAVKVPEVPGKYELRRLHHGKIVAKTVITVTKVAATVKAPATAVGGSSLPVTWTGPNNQYDRLGLVPAGSPDGHKPIAHSFLFSGSPTGVKLPEQPGKYEVRYLTGQSGSTLAKTAVTVTAATAVIEGPIEAIAGKQVRIAWKGPGNRLDRFAIAAKGSPDNKWIAGDYLFGVNPKIWTAPSTPGEYEVRYIAGDSRRVLARAKLIVTPAQLAPGLIQVDASKAHNTVSGSGGAVEVILDASGSMLKRIGSQRRIDVAAATLKKLTSSTIPAGTRFALRVFGSKVGSCQTNLAVPLRPLEPAAVAAQVDAIAPRSLARTPIAASLEAVSRDLQGVSGERLVVLITDGEETCGGDPADAITRLRAQGVNVRVNIVGFAIDDAALAEKFRQWSEAGGGTYFDARDAAGLDKALTLAMRPAFEVVDGKSQVVAHGYVGGNPVQVKPGIYTVRLAGGSGASQRVTVEPKQTARVGF